MSEESEATHVGYLWKRKCEPLCIIQPKISFSKRAQLLLTCQNQQANNSYNDAQGNREHCFSTKEASDNQND